MNYVKTLQDQIEAMIQGFVQQVPALAISLIVLIMTWVIAKFAVQIAGRLTRNAQMRDNLKQLVETLVRLAIWLVGLMIAATVAMPGLTPASLFAGLGVGALAIGFAFQDIFENFLAGVLIMVRDRMRIGDSIQCQNISGTIERITLRETLIRAPSNELTIVPNSVLFKNPVLISTDSPLRRFEMTTSVADDNDLDVAKAAIHQAVLSVDGVDKDRGVKVFARDAKPGQVDFLTRWWAIDRSRDDDRRDAIIRAIARALRDAGVDMPSSTSELTIAPLERRRLVDALTN